MFTPAVAEIDWSTFLTTDESPWWSTLAGVLAGGVLTYLTSSVIEKRKMRANREERVADEQVAARESALDLVARFDAEIESLRLQSIAHQYQWSLEHPDYVHGAARFDGEWPASVHARYAEIRMSAIDLRTAASITYSRLKLLPNVDIEQAAIELWSAYQVLAPSDNDTMFGRALDALDDARHVLLSVVKNLYQYDHLVVPGKDGLHRVVKDQILGRRAVVGGDTRIKTVFVPDGTDSTILNLQTDQAFQSIEASRFVASQFLDEGQSAAVFIIELMDGSSDFYAIGLPTEGRPVSNVPIDPVEEVVEASGAHFVRPGTLRHFLVSEEGEIISSRSEYVDGAHLGVSSPDLLARAEKQRFLKARRLSRFIFKRRLS